MDRVTIELQKKHNIFILPSMFKTGLDIGLGFGCGFTIVMGVFFLALYALMQL